MKKISETKYRQIAIDNIVPTLRVRKVPIKNIEIKDSLEFSEAAVYACNHTNSHDISTFLKYVNNDQRIVVQDTDDLSKITRLFFHIIDVIYANVDKGADNTKLFEEVKKTLNCNKVMNKVGIFPEGVFNFSENKFMNYCKSGAARFAIDNYAPIIPVMLEFDNFLCYLNEGPRLYFLNDDCLSPKFSSIINKLFSDEDYISGKRVILIHDKKTNINFLYSLNSEIQSYDYLLENYDRLVNNDRVVSLTNLYLNTDEKEATEILRGEIATMKWYLYESFGIRKNNQKLADDFYSNAQATKDEYPSLDYDLADSRRFRLHTDPDEVLSSLCELEPENNVGFAISKGFERTRKTRDNKML